MKKGLVPALLISGALVTGVAMLNEEWFLQFSSSSEEVVSEERMETKEVYEHTGKFDIGDKARIPGWDWVEVMNEDPITQRFSNMDSYLYKGDTCGVQTGGYVEVLAFAGKDKILVEYESPGSPMGTPCPTGVQYLIEEDEFSGLTAKYNKKISEAANLEQQVANIILEGKSYYDGISIQDHDIYVGSKAEIDDWDWVDVLNLEAITQNYRNSSSDIGFNKNGDYDTCGVEKGGTIEVLGILQDKRLLVEYTAPGNPAGTPCPSGTHFMMQPGEFIQLME